MMSLRAMDLLEEVMMRLTPLSEDIPRLYLSRKKAGEDKLLHYHSEIVACKTLVELAEAEMQQQNTIAEELSQAVFNAQVALSHLAKYLSLLFMRESDGQALPMN